MKFSIITPTLNSAATIDEAIRSVLDQGDLDFEHVVVDGGSTDGTLDILRGYPHLVWTSEPDKGQSDAMNKGFAMSSGDVISYLNADDAYDPGAFAEVRRCFGADPEMMFLVGRLRVLKENRPEEISRPNLEFRKMLRYFDCNAFPLNPVSYFYRREVQEAVGGFDASMHYNMDHKFLLEAALRFDMKRTEKVLGRFNMHAATKTAFVTSTDFNHWKIARFTRAYYRYLPWWHRLAANVWYFTEGHYLCRRFVGRVFGKLRTILKY